MGSVSDTPDLAAWLREEVEADHAHYAMVVAHLEPIAVACEAEPHYLATMSPLETTRVQLTDARDRAARCEAELAILGEHAPTDWTVYGDHCCRRCKYDDDEPERDEMHHWAVFPCRTVRLLGSGYRHRPGYQEEWAP